FGILIEHYAGRFPTWLAPVQAVVLTITEAHNDWAIEVRDRLRAAGIRADADVRNEKIGYKVRAHTMQKVPWLFIVGDQEQEAKAVSPRDKKGKNLGITPLDDVITSLVEEIASRK
ncbi:MAG: threonine--tRNA ligase, partial [Magnetococcales bacterium]|nr:threonine--tRNA ligase [Magnetococcales bacterium]